MAYRYLIQIGDEALLEALSEVAKKLSLNSQDLSEVQPMFSAARRRLISKKLSEIGSSNPQEAALIRDVLSHW
jgi:hypothetical protein